MQTTKNKIQYKTYVGKSPVGQLSFGETYGNRLVTSNDSGSSVAIE